MGKRGRPPLSEHEESHDVTVAMTGSMYDRAYDAARVARVSVPEVIRRALDRELSDTKSVPAKSPLTL